ncbi:MAG: S46 family peptidase [Bacteroidia bacterium]|nr:S46 family peptidase [Bacteroidia bacterium]
MKNLFRKTWLLAGLFAFVLSGTLRADEGMWLPIYIKQLESRMQQMGSKLTAEDIYSVNKASIKDAIVSFGGFCTGEIVSSKGLVFTNHHCGYDKIAELSTTQNNWLKDGFWAKSNEQEIPAPGLFVRILVRMENVTDKVKAAEDPEAAKAEMISAAEKEGAGYEAEVEEYFYGNDFYLLVYQVYKDIRLVGTPPENVGKFGGDTDNWMWPRHTGDFSIFRIYADANNNPAEYSPNNKPYQPKHHLPVSLKGIKQNDFSFIMGFPGRTQRYLTSDQIKKTISVDYPMSSSIMDVKLKTMKSFMDKDEAVKIQLASDYASLANYWKYMLGNIYSAKNSDFIEQKQAFEERLQKWIDADKGRSEKWGNLIADIKKIQTADEASNKLGNFLNFGYFGPAIVGAATRFYQLGNAITNDKKQPEKVQAQLDRVKAGLDKQFKEFNATVDEAVFVELGKYIMANLPKEDWPAEFSGEAFQKMKGANDQEKLKAYAANMYKKSIFANRAAMEKFLKKPSKKALDADPGYKYMQSVIGLYFKVMGAAGASEQAEGELMKEYMQAIREFTTDKPLYPDANSTLRFTFGSVQGYNGVDGKEFKFFTTADGILEKEKPGDLEFDVPKKLHDLIVAKDFGRYGNNGDLNVCFLTTHDITGGNSGSPVIDGEGNLIGIAFDGNWESMVGDLSYQPKTQRTISVDIRYVLFFIDKYAGATNLIEELSLKQ